jgi:anaerobic selenocysteine-containing dehydrogenase
MPILKSACPLDCPDACSLEVEVQDGRVASIDGNHKNPLTQGFICGKVRNFAAHLYGEDRILRPAVRAGEKGTGEFEAVSWDEALGLVAAKLDSVRRRSGGEAILPFYYGGSNGFLTQGAADARLFHRLGASTLLRTFCAAPSGRAATGLTGKMPGVALLDYVHSRLIVLWGVNPSATGIHLVPVIQKARSRGAQAVVIDPRRIRLARSADLHLPLIPGTDLVLALAVVRWLFEQGAADHEFLGRHTTGADRLREKAAPWTFDRAAEVTGLWPGDIESFARLYADSSPAVIRCGWGAERNRNGGSAIAAILALPAVAGKFGVRGGGYTMSNSGVWPIDTAAASATTPPRTREVNMSLLGEALLNLKDPRIEVLFVYNSNPLATAPSQEKVRGGLRREDLFTVVFDQVLTDTALYADVVLPATTFLEHEELSRGYGAMVLQRSHAVIPPTGEARPNYDVFADLCRRLGLEKPGDPKTPDEMVRALLATTPGGERLGRELAGQGAAVPETGSTPIQFADVFPFTPDRRMHLFPEALARESGGTFYVYKPPPAGGRFPLSLISPATGQSISSTFGQLRQKPAEVGIHPEDAAARGIRDGATVRVFNDQAEVRCRARLDEDLRPGVACLNKGLWARHFQNGRTANALAPDHLTDLGGGACYNDARVEISPALT